MFIYVCSSTEILLFLTVPSALRGRHAVPAIVSGDGVTAVFASTTATKTGFGLWSSAPPHQFGSVQVPESAAVKRRIVRTYLVRRHIQAADSVREPKNLPDILKTGGIAAPHRRDDWPVDRTTLPGANYLRRSENRSSERCDGVVVGPGTVVKS